MTRPPFARRLRLRPVACLGAAAGLAATLLAGCALLQPPALRSGMNEAEVVALLGRLTARHALPQGGQRLEFARGPFGRETWMVDLDAQGRSTAWLQALEEPRLHAFQQRAPGMSRDELLRTLGTPGERAGAFRGIEIWSWRYRTNDCLWFQVTLEPAGGPVRDAGWGPDPMCDRGERDGRK